MEQCPRNIYRWLYCAIHLCHCEVMGTNMHELADFFCGTTTTDAMIFFPYYFLIKQWG